MKRDSKSVMTCAVASSLMALGAVDVASAAPPSCSPFPCVPPPDGPGPLDSETELNNSFATRDVLPGSSRCSWQREFFARLGPVDLGNPDTVLGLVCAPIASSTDGPVGPESTLDTSPTAEQRALSMRFGEENTPGGSASRGISVNDDGGRWARWGGSALIFRSCAGLVFDVLVTGKGCDPIFDVAPCPHGQSGLYEVIINFFDAAGGFIGSDCFRSTLSGTDIDRFTRAAPVGTFDFDIFVNPLAAYHGDVDYFEVGGLRPGEEYIVRTRGLSAREQDRTLDTIIVSFNGSGVITGSNDDIGEVGTAPNNWWNRNSRLVIRADASGRIFFAVTGFNDFDADGRQDPADLCLHTETGSYDLRVAHRCDLGCIDLSNNCVVDFDDVLIVLGAWGRTCQ